MMRKYLLWMAGIVATFTGLRAQQEPMYTHYMYNTQVVNPAYAGSREALTFTGLVRAQWIDFPKRPGSQTISLHSPVVSQHFGMGFSFANDQIAHTSLANGQVDFAFRFFVGKHGQLSLGLKGSLSRFSEDLAQVPVKDARDPVFAGNIRGRVAPNFGTGVYFKHDRYYIGLSIPELLERQLRTAVVAGNFPGFRQRHYYAIFGMRFDLENRIQFKPTAMVKYTLHAPLQVDLTASLLFRDKISTGLMYRYHDAVGLLLGFNFTEQLQVGYSFDWSVSNRTGRFNNGSHEFMLRYDFLFRNSQKARSSRYF